MVRPTVEQTYLPKSQVARGGRAKGTAWGIQAHDTDTMAPLCQSRGSCDLAHSHGVWVSLAKVDRTEISCHDCLPCLHLLSISLALHALLLGPLYMPPRPPPHPHPSPAGTLACSSWLQPDDLEGAGLLLFLNVLSLENMECAGKQDKALATTHRCTPAMVGWGKLSLWPGSRHHLGWPALALRRLGRPPWLDAWHWR